jgi:5-methylthioadenosine/S-adenosylhomocysteine deaminase
MPAKDVFRLATKDGARALHLDKVGTLNVGYKADVVILDLNDPRFFPLRKENIMAFVVSWAHAGHVDTVMVDGKVLMEGRRIKVLDEAKIMEEAEPIGDGFVNEFMKR